MFRPDAAVKNHADRPSASCEIAFEGLRLHWSRYGQGPKTVIFVHGWACDESIWHLQVVKLASDYRVITLDLPGHGQSQAPTNTELTLDLFARAVEAVRVDANAALVVLVGHSLGAAVLLRYVRLFPKRVAALVLTEAVLTKRRTIAFDTGKLTGPDAKEVFETLIRNTLFSESTTPAIRAYVLSMMLGMPNKIVIGVVKAMLDPSSWTDEPVHAPILAIYKAKSRMAGRNTIKHRFPTIEYYEIADAGHFLMIEKPDEFNRLLRGFLEKQTF